MDQNITELISESWHRVEAEAPAMAEAFYERLFDLDPTLRDLFAAAEMDSQQVKFAAMLAELVRLVQNPDRFEAVLAESGRRHAGYGVLGRHYHTVGEALLWALDTALPGGMDDATRGAWAEAYTRMAFLMKKAGARGAQDAGSSYLS